MNKVKNQNSIIILHIAKGLSIILMTLVHYPFFTSIKDIYPNYNFLVGNFVMIFVVPIFIFISGYLFNNKLSFKAFFLNKMDGLLKPLIGFLLSLTILKIFLHTIISDKITLGGIIKYFNAFFGVFVYGDLDLVNIALWFVAAFFLGLLVFKGALVILGFKKPLNYILFSSLILLLFVSSNSGFKGYYLHHIPVFVTYFALGYSFKKISIKYLNGISFFYSKVMIAFPVLFFISWFILNRFNFKTTLSLYSPYDGFNYHYLLLLSLFGIFSVFCICSYLEKIPWLSKVLVECSKASFFILAYHVFILDIYRLIFDFNVYNPMLHFSLFVLNILLCYIIYRTFIKIPFLRMLFIPLKKLELYKNEIKLLKYKLICKIIPKEILVLK